MAALLFLLTSLALVGVRPRAFGAIAVGLVVLMMVVALRQIWTSDSTLPPWVGDQTRTATAAASRLWPWLLGLTAALMDLGIARRNEKAA